MYLTPCKRNRIIRMKQVQIPLQGVNNGNYIMNEDQPWNEETF